MKEIDYEHEDAYLDELEDVVAALADAGDIPGSIMLRDIIDGWKDGYVSDAHLHIAVESARNRLPAEASSSREPADG